MNTFDKADKISTIINPIATALKAYPTITVDEHLDDIVLSGTVEDGATIPIIIAELILKAGATKLINHIEVADISSQGLKMKVNTEHSNLNMREKPSLNADIVGKVAQDEIITIVKKTNADWYLIKTNDGEEGYSATEYLAAV